MGWLPFTAKQLWNVQNIILPTWVMIGYDVKSPITKKLTIGSSVVLASIYASIIIPSIISPPADAPPMDFFSLEGVVSLFHNSNEEGVLAGWIHYVIFDMLAATWIANDYQTNIKFNYFTKLYEIGCLATTMMLGPCGLLLHLIGKYTFLPESKNKEKFKDV